MCKNTKKGFTLIEMLVVIAILGVLGSVVTSSVNKAREKALTTKALLTLKQIQNAIGLLEQDTDQWPGHTTSAIMSSGTSGNEIWNLNAGNIGLITNDTSVPYRNWNGPYYSHSEVPLDPWGNPYFFDLDYDVDPTSGTKWEAVIGSFGPNGLGQNVYDDDNVIIVIARDN